MEQFSQNSLHLRFGVYDTVRRTSARMLPDNARPQPGDMAPNFDAPFPPDPASSYKLAAAPAHRATKTLKSLKSRLCPPSFVFFRKPSNSGLAIKDFRPRVRSEAPSSLLVRTLSLEKRLRFLPPALLQRHKILCPAHLDVRSLSACRDKVVFMRQQK